MSFRFKNSQLYSEEFVTYKMDEPILSGILHALKQMAKNKHNKLLSTIQLVVLMKILCSFFFVCSNCHSDMKSLKVNRVTDDNLDLLLLFNLFLLVFLVLY